MTTSQSETQRTKKETKRGHTGQSQCPLKKWSVASALSRANNTEYGSCSFDHKITSNVIFKRDGYGEHLYLIHGCECKVVTI